MNFKKGEVTFITQGPATYRDYFGHGAALFD